MDRSKCQHGTLNKFPTDSLTHIPRPHAHLFHLNSIPIPIWQGLLCRCFSGENKNDEDPVRDLLFKLSCSQGKQINMEILGTDPKCKKERVDVSSLVCCLKKQQKTLSICIGDGFERGKWRGWEVKVEVVDSEIWAWIFFLLFYVNSRISSTFHFTLHPKTSLSVSILTWKIT